MDGEGRGGDSLDVGRGTVDRSTKEAPGRAGAVLSGSASAPSRNFSGPSEMASYPTSSNPRPARPALFLFRFPNLPHVSSAPLARAGGGEKVSWSEVRTFSG